MIKDELRKAILEDLKLYGDVAEKSYFLKESFDEETNMYSLVYNFTNCEKILYQAKKFIEKFSDGYIEVQRVYITKEMLDVFKLEGRTSMEESKKETAPEVSVQEQYVQTNAMHIRTTDFEKIAALLGAITKPIDFTSKFKIVLSYNPNNSTVELNYFKSE